MGEFVGQKCNKYLQEAKEKMANRLIHCRSTLGKDILYLRVYNLFSRRTTHAILARKPTPCNLYLLHHESSYLLVRISKSKRESAWTQNIVSMQVKFDKANLGCLCYVFDRSNLLVDVMELFWRKSRFPKN